MRLEDHPILDVKARRELAFTFDGMDMVAMEGEVLSSALFANGIRIFNRHHTDDSPQGIFCANGQCAQCLVLADGVPVKACITLVRGGMVVSSIRGLPILPEDEGPCSVSVQEVSTDVLVVGGGPAGLTAAIELGKMSVQTILVDDKHELFTDVQLSSENIESNCSCNYGCGIFELTKKGKLST